MTTQPIQSSSDLPREIGNPAKEAFIAAGYTTISQVVNLSDKEMLALHGVGPKAVRILREMQSRTNDERLKHSEVPFVEGGEQ